MFCDAVLFLLTFLLFLEFLHVLVEGVHSAFPETPERIQPGSKLLERSCPQLIDALLGDWLHVDQTSLAEDTQVFGNLGLMQRQSLGDLSDWAGSIAQKLHDAKTIRLGKSI
jgi:hypothetical protein